MRMLRAQRGLEQRFDRAFVHGGINQRGRGAVAQQFVEEEACRFVGDGAVGEARLGRKGVVVQPVEQMSSPATR